MGSSALGRRVALFAVLLLLSLLGTTPALQSPGKANGARLRGLNGSLLQLVSQLRRTGPDSADALREQIRSIGRQRQEALEALIQARPAEAASLAFPEELVAELAALNSDLAARLEIYGLWQGTVEYIVEDDEAMASHRSQRRLHTGTEVLDLQFSGDEPAGLKSGDILSVRGVRSGGSVAAAGGEILASTSAAGAVCSPTGAQKVVAILVNFANYSLPSSVTPELVKGILFGNAHSSSQSTPDWSIDDFWQQNSDGQTWVDVAGSTVVGPYLLSRDYNNDTNGDGIYECESSAIRSAAIAAADPSVNFLNYSRVLIVMPKNTKLNVDGTTGGCTWAGLGSIGCWSNSSNDGSFTASIAWQRADQMASRGNGVKLTSHEFGHNLTMNHARSRDFGADAIGPLGSAGTLSSYGDGFSTMGSWNFGFYSAHHASQQLNWLAPTTNYLQIESNGTFTIQNYEGRPAGLKALKIRRGTGNNAWVWVESRKNTGIYSSQLGSQVWSGALIHYQDSSTGSYTDLADFTTATSTMSDPALAVGQTWVDSYTNLSLQVASAAADSLTVTVNYGALPCNNANPTVAVSPISASTDQGTSKAFSVAVTNNSSAGCSSSTFNMTSVVPSTWGASFASDTLTIAPGQQGQTSLTVSVPSGYPLGTYPISATATNAAFSGTGNANLTVTEPAYSLTVNSDRGTVNINPPNTNCRGACTQNYPQSAGTSVLLTVSALDKGYAFKGWSGACTGTQSTCTVSMTAARSVTATYARVKGGK
ncbi:MAG: hypothetical protein FJW26_13560 [Acidimicrobiia bacterium]|nr:hypothetical protein [Acidimicrobiia bacterium]